MRTYRIPDSLLSIACIPCMHGIELVAVLASYVYSSMRGVMPYLMIHIRLPPRTEAADTLAEVDLL